MLKYTSSYMAEDIFGYMGYIAATLKNRYGGGTDSCEGTVYAQPSISPLKICDTIGTLYLPNVSFLFGEGQGVSIITV